MSTQSIPTTLTFLSEISSLITRKDAAQIAQFLIIEPPYSSSYEQIIAELRRAYPRSSPSSSFASGSTSSDDALESVVSSRLAGAVSADADGAGPSWNAFVKFMGVYLAFLRDVDVGNLLETYNLLSDLLQKANSALSHQTNGYLILPTVVQYSRVLSRLAIGLDKQPHLIAHLIPKSSGEDGGPRETLPERAANILRQAFVICLNDRSGAGTGGLNSSTRRPEGKRRGIYTIANLCLRILFACHKTRGCAQIFENIYNQSPPLNSYPKSERVTYLYYLGRFLWGNGHVYRAQKTLQQAWNECNVQCASSQGRLILIYLIAANLICGRFPSAQLLSHPSAQGVRDHFEPLCRYIAQGDLCSFRRHLDVGSAHYAWFSHYRLDLQLWNRCEVLVWRSLVRKTFLISGDPGDPSTRKAPTVDLNVVLTLFYWQERKYVTPPGQMQPNVYVDPDFAGSEDMQETEEQAALVLPDMTSIFSKMSALIHQEFLNGYLSFSRRKLAIQGARVKGALAAGFPNIWEAVEKRCNADGDGDEIPGWKVEDAANRKRKMMGAGAGAKAGGAFGPGMVVNLSGARPAGASPFG
ncbi:hypothetical protein AAFC00_001027 [Neodothiora populina]|uniref:COP9 signalosome complex subunit 12 n=1 Tax=Neodothiora populina TaxID=2781224 RepID=A0ABR3PMK8_9PEZI